MKNILAISGSLRAKSTNLRIIENVAVMSSDHFRVFDYRGLSALPAFNPDLNSEGKLPPAEVADFRRRIREADGVLICTPEYVFARSGRAQKRD